MCVYVYIQTYTHRQINIHIYKFLGKFAMTEVLGSIPGSTPPTLPKQK